MPADLLSALGAIDSGVTCVLDWSHIQNTPEHTDACIKGLAESGVRAVFAYGNPQNETGRYWEIADGTNIPATSRGCASSISPATINCSRSTWRRRRRRPELILAQFKAARDVGARITIHVGVGEFGRSALLEKLNADEGAEIGHDLHPLLHAQRHRVEADQGHRRHGLDRRLCRDADGARQSADPEGDRHRHPARRSASTSKPRCRTTSSPQMRTVFSLQKNEVWARRLAGDKNPPASS